jgi:hypothetical protein
MTYVTDHMIIQIIPIMPKTPANAATGIALRVTRSDSSKRGSIFITYSSSP